MKPLLATVAAIAVLSLGLITFLRGDRTELPRHRDVLSAFESVPIRPLSLSPNPVQAERLRHSGIRLGHSKISSMRQNDRGFTLSKPLPLHLDRQSGDPPLRPGLYQTYPYAMILAVPGRGPDDGILGESPGNNPGMPILKPHIETVPLPSQ